MMHAMAPMEPLTPEEDQYRQDTARVYSDTVAIHTKAVAFKTKTRERYASLSIPSSMMEPCFNLSTNLDLVFSNALKTANESTRETIQIMLKISQKIRSEWQEMYTSLSREYSLLFKSVRALFDLAVQEKFDSNLLSNVLSAAQKSMRGDTRGDAMMGRLMQDKYFTPHFSSPAPKQQEQEHIKASTSSSAAAAASDEGDADQSSSNSSDDDDDNSSSATATRVPERAKVTLDRLHRRRILGK